LGYPVKLNDKYIVSSWTDGIRVRPADYIVEILTKNRKITFTYDKYHDGDEYSSWRIYKTKKNGDILHPIVDWHEGNASNALSNLKLLFDKIKHGKEP
jgi:hypothetical protein